MIQIIKIQIDVKPGTAAVGNFDAAQLINPSSLGVLRRDA